MRTVAVITLIVWICGVRGQYDFEPGNRCKLPNGEDGTCVTLRDCPSALADLKMSISPKTCSFNGKDPVVCCKMLENLQSVSKSQQQCGQYYRKRIASRFWYWPEAYELVGGFRSSAREFPHMAALGYGEPGDVTWGCGGSLISEKFVLTAAHCINSKSLGPVKYIRLGDLNLKETTDDAQPQDFNVVRTTRHPDYKPPAQYNDIALIELDKPVQITRYVKPACLQWRSRIEDPVWIATGWGNLEFGGETADHLQKANLREYSNAECNNIYGSNPRRLMRGIVEETQICAGEDNRDTCQGDSGGPLQIKNAEYTEGYTIIGITSFGKACGVSKSPGVYTRISGYIDWIESVVWGF